MEVLLLDEADVRSLLTMSDTIEAVELAFREKALGRVQMPAKPYLNFEKHHGDLRVMPSYIESLDAAGAKIVNSHPENVKKYGLPTVIATIVLVEPKTGRPICIMGGTWLTAMRTGAASGVATKYLARQDSEVLSLVGAGAQAMTQVMGVSHVSSLEEVKVWSKDRDVGKRFIKDASSRFDFKFTECDGPQESVKGSDIISTITPATSPVVADEWVQPGVHINAIGADGPGKQELDVAILKRAKIVIDDWGQAVHGGEVNVALEKALITEKQIYGELGEIIIGRKRARASPEEITIFDSTGLSIQDVSTAMKVYEKARAQGRGKILDF